MRMASVPVPLLPFLLLTLPVAVAVTLGSAGCGDDSADLPEGCDALVRPGADAEASQTLVQTAFIEAEAGHTLCFEGDFQFSDELLLTQDGITLMGSGAGATFDFSTQEVGANGIHVQSVEGFRIQDMTVKNTPGDGVRVTDSTDVVFRNATVMWDAGPDEANGAYGVYPVGCTNVLIEDSEVSGASDAGIYVGQSENIIVRRNVAWGNVAGIEIENSTHADVYDNEARDNTGGILVFDLPDLPAGQGGRVKVHDNVITNNNEINFATPGSIVAYLPTGTGVMILTMDDVEVHNNTITGHDSTGLLLISFEVVQAVGAGGRPGPEYEPYPERVHIHDNSFSGNGGSPQGLLVQVGPAPLEDILWDGIVPPDGTDPEICIQNNGDAGFRNFNLQLPDFEFGEPSMDLTPHDCAGESLPAVELDL